MRRLLPLAATVCVLLGFGATTTYAVKTTTPSAALGSQLGSTVQLGGTAVPVKSPVCPKGTAPQSCTFVMTRVTALQTVINGATYPTAVKQSGQIVAFTVGLAQLSSNPSTAKSFTSQLNAKYGGASEAELTVLNPGKNNQFTVAAQGPVEQLQSYLGYVVQFPLATPIPVRPGQVVALTVGTWAPVLSYNLASKYYSYRQSRSFNCKTVGTQQNAVTGVGQTKSFACSYPGTRAEYSATEVTNPVVP